MKKAFYIILTALLSIPYIRASQFILPEVNEPKTLTVSGNSLVISENESILIYSLAERKLIKSFGKNGEGPGEFKLGHGAGSLKIDIIRDVLLVNSGGKLSWFTLGGEFVREVKIPPMTYMIPAGNQYIGNCLSPVEGGFPTLSICIFDRDMNRVKPLFESGVPVGMGAKMMVPAYNFIYRIDRENIFLSAGTDEIRILVFDYTGKKSGEINLKDPPLKIGSVFKDSVRKFYQNDPVYKNYWEYIRQNMYFPENFPALKEMLVNDGRLFIQTWSSRESQFEWIITDLSGKIIKRMFLPQNIESAIAYSPVTISNGTYFYLKENPDEEIWELKMIDLEL